MSAKVATLWYNIFTNPDPTKANHNKKIWVQDGPSSFKKAPRPYTGCKQYKVYLFSACFNSYDHKHRSVTPPVVAVVQ